MQLYVIFNQRKRQLSPASGAKHRSRCSKESVHARLRVLVKRILRKHKYPPDDPVTGDYTVSVSRVLEQAEGMVEV